MACLERNPTSHEWIFLSPRRCAPIKRWRQRWASSRSSGWPRLGAVAFYYAARTHAATRYAAVGSRLSALCPRRKNASVRRRGNFERVNERACAECDAGAVTLADRLLRQARHLRERGDTTTALARLQEAVQTDPKNANVLAEMAMIYESIQLFDRSNETWRRVQELGPSAGPLYELADMKLRIGVPRLQAHRRVPRRGGRLGARRNSRRLDFRHHRSHADATNDPDAESHLMLARGSEEAAGRDRSITRR